MTCSCLYGAHCSRFYKRWFKLQTIQPRLLFLPAPKAQMTATTSQPTGNQSGILIASSRQNGPPKQFVCSLQSSICPPHALNNYQGSRVYVSG